jgi:hypothetical protein
LPHLLTSMISNFCGDAKRGNFSSQEIGTCSVPPPYWKSGINILKNRNLWLLFQEQIISSFSMPTCLPHPSGNSSEKNRVQGFMGSSECGFWIADFGFFIPHSTFCIPQLKGPLNPRPLESFQGPSHIGRKDSESNRSELPFPLPSESLHLLLHRPRRNASGLFG